MLDTSADEHVDRKASAVPAASNSDERAALDVEVEVEEGGVGGEGGAAVVEEAEADEVVAGDEELGGCAVGCDADDATAAVQAGSNVDVAVGVEREALR